MYTQGESSSASNTALDFILTGGVNAVIRQRLEQMLEQRGMTGITVRLVLK